MPSSQQKLTTGKPFPMGAHWDGLGVNFAVFSAHATRMELCIFDSSGRHETARLELPDCTDEVFHGYLPQAKPGLVYGYRAHGPYQPEAGHRFNPNKLLLDPYAKKLQGQLHWSDALFGYRIGANRGDLSFDRRDSAVAMPKAVVMNDIFQWGNDSPPNTPWEDTVIYEAHVRGLTKRHPEIAPPARGNFAALGDPWIIEHLQKLGITAIELMPISAFLQDRFLLQRGLRNYWGYSTLAFFATEPSYLSTSDGTPYEVQQAVRRLHAAGIEVILDVVYNHTCEGSELGPTLSWRGLDNLSYYQSVQGQPRHLVNDTGCGNTLNITHPRVLQMVMDSLRHWAATYRVDGFRFDLGTTMGREANGFNPRSGFFNAILQDPALSHLKLIAEPWDVGPGGYQLGNHPPSFAEWNDRFRDGTRRFWRGDDGMRGEIAARLLGSSDIFEKSWRKTWASINFCASHDGFTLADITAYAERHNEANGEDNWDGHSENFSANYGVEGPAEEPDILEIRGNVQRAMLGTLFVSHGTPMLPAGDELGRTQQGNNNAYCQDNEISWVDWSAILSQEPTPEKSLLQFTQRLARLRAAHPSLRSKDFMHGNTEILPGLNNVAWFDEMAEPLTPDAWANPTAQLLALRRAVFTGNTADITLVLFNASAQPHEFIYPNQELPWEIELYSAEPDSQTIKPPPERMEVAAHALVLLAARVAR
jgi:isoamylase